MNNAEFVQATSKLEAYYAKEYTTEQLKIMFDMLKEWNVEKYRRAINYCIRNSKYLPKIADLTSADCERSGVAENKKIDFIKCKKCNNEGFIKYSKKIKDGERILEYDYVALCTCENASKQKTINKYNFPTLAELGM